MDELLASRPIQRLAATLGVVGSLALAFFYILVPALTVPYPAPFAFYTTWGIVVVLAIAWWSRHPWRSFLTPIVALMAVLVMLQLGGAYLGWGG